MIQASHTHVAMCVFLTLMLLYLCVCVLCVFQVAPRVSSGTLATDVPATRTEAAPAFTTLKATASAETFRRTMSKQRKSAVNWVMADTDKVGGVYADMATLMKIYRFIW